MELLDGSLSVVTRALLSWSLAELQPFRLERMSLPPTLAYCALPGLPRVVSSALHVVPTYVSSWSIHRTPRVDRHSPRVASTQTLPTTLPTPPTTTPQPSPAPHGISDTRHHFTPTTTLLPNNQAGRPRGRTESVRCCSGIFRQAQAISCGFLRGILASRTVLQQWLGCSISCCAVAVANRLS